MPKKQRAEYLEEKNPADFDGKIETIEQKAEENKPAKKDLVSRMMQRKMNKAEKKTGVNITIRKKGE
jgi:hypothetical protein